jgi:hypothetical protein
MGQFVENLERDVLSDEAAVVAEAANEAGADGAAVAAIAYEHPQTGPRKIDAPEAQPVDLLAMGGAPVTKRLVPLGIAAVALFVLWRILRRR